MNFPWELLKCINLIQMYVCCITQTRQRMLWVPVGPHMPCTAWLGAGTQGAGELLASAGRGLGHSSRTPLGTYAL